MKQKQDSSFLSMHKYKILIGFMLVMTFIVLHFEEKPLWYGIIYLIADIILFCIGRKKGIYRKAQITEYFIHIDDKYKNMPFDGKKIIPYEMPFSVKYADFIQIFLGIGICAFTMHLIAPITTMVFWLIYLPNSLSYVTGMLDGEQKINMILDEMMSQLAESHDSYIKYCIDNSCTPFDQSIAKELDVHLELREYISSVIEGQGRFNVKSGKKTAYPVVYNTFKNHGKTVVVIPDFNGIFVLNETEEYKIGKNASSLLQRCILAYKENNNNLPFATETNNLVLQKEEKKLLISV